MALLRMEMERTQEVFRILGNRKGGGGAVYAGTLGAVSEATQTRGSIHVSKDGRYTVRNTYTGKQHALDYSTFCVVYLQKSIYPCIAYNNYNKNFVYSYISFATVHFRFPRYFSRVHFQHSHGNQPAAGCQLSSHNIHKVLPLLDD